MAKISQTIPQKEKASSSQCAADETPVKSQPEECVPGACVLTSDFNVDKGSSIPGRCLGKDAVLRPLSTEEETLASVPKPVKENKRKRVFISEDQKSKKRMTRVIWDAQDLGALDLDKPYDGEDPFRDLFTSIEDIVGTSDESDHFHGVQQALNQATTVHREACSRSQNELRRYKADLQRVTEERNSLKLLLGQREEKIKDLRAELAKAYRDQTDLSEQLQQKIEIIGKLREEVDVIKVESLQWKEGMDHFSAERETARAQLSSAETQHQRIKEKGLVQARRIEELEAGLTSELAKAKYNAEKVAELAKCHFRRETLEEIHARGFDLAEEIKRAKELEADAEALASDGDDDDDDDDDGRKSESENGGCPVEKRPLPISFMP
ncbi:uncharacterized protein [Nicotiana tomentosiformis]|uniref:uncharacterized protein n=1 Tax=Nicotiana tomentosiformis TaxID=4098 RepID=UPI00388C8A6B